MKANKTTAGKLAGAGILTALAASLCCIAPFLAFFSGAAGAATAFTWIEPFRPYLIGITIIVLGVAWYGKLIRKKHDNPDCACNEEIKTAFFQTKTFLGLVTGFVLLMLAFPYFGNGFYPENKKEIIVVKQNDIRTLHLNVEGITCSFCNAGMENAALRTKGVLDAIGDKTNTDTTFGK